MSRRAWMHENDHASITQRTQMPCGNSEGVVYSLGSGVIGQILNEKSYACSILLRSRMQGGVGAGG